LDKCVPLGEKAFISRLGKFNISMYEAIFRAVCKKSFENRDLNVEEIDVAKFNGLKENSKFIDSTQSHTTNKTKVRTRLRMAIESL